MSVHNLAKGINLISIADWDIRHFHGPTYTTHRGTTYNAYLVRGGKQALVDTVYHPFAPEFIAQLSILVQPGSLDYVVVNHIEPDHSSSLPAVMELHPDATIICTAKAKAGLEAYYQTAGWHWQVVKTGDGVDLDGCTLRFIEAPMLHWPDSMFTYVPEQAVLLPNDAFGQHLAWAKPFDDQNDMAMVMAEAAKYYANILSPFSTLVTRKLAELNEMQLDVKIIAPSHGIVWRKHPDKILSAYANWASGRAEERVVVVYDTMWGSTEKMARAIVAGIAQQGVDVRLFKVSVSDHNDIIAQLLEAKALVVGSSTINNDMLPVLKPFLEELKGLKPVGKIGAVFGSHGWRGGAVESIGKDLDRAGIAAVVEPLKIQWIPDQIQLDQCRQWGEEIAAQVKTGS